MLSHDEIVRLYGPWRTRTPADAAELFNGYGPIPPGMARQMTGHTKTFVRRLFTRSAGGAEGNETDTAGAIGEAIVGRDPRRRRFDGPLGDLIRSIDQHCQMPWRGHLPAR